MSRFDCPHCGCKVGHPSRTCESNCVMVKHWAQPNADERAVAAAKDASDHLVREISRLWDTKPYLEAVSHGASSGKFQALIYPTLSELGYLSEVRHRVLSAGFRPDFVIDTCGTTVMVEVERGKTLDNNMDMLDMWKCHIHPTARHLILLVPIWYVKVREGRSPSCTPTFAKVCRRMEPFFEPANGTNVKSLHLIGY